MPIAPSEYFGSNDAEQKIGDKKNAEKNFENNDHDRILSQARVYRLQSLKKAISRKMSIASVMGIPFPWGMSPPCGA
jgi:hypothetical protein